MQLSTQTELESKIGIVPKVLSSIIMLKDCSYNISGLPTVMTILQGPHTHTKI